MRIRTRKRVLLKSIVVAVCAILPFTYVGYYAIRVSEIYSDLVQFSFENAPDSSTFMPVNYTLLNEMVLVYDDRFEKYHMPLNMTSACWFKDANFSTVTSWSYGDNEALWTGTAMNGYVHKYLAAVREQNDTMKEDALRVIRKLATGMSYMVIVPNGGLGSEYGGILARGYAPPTEKVNASYYFRPNDRFFNGTGNYSQWRWKAYTSNDEYGGYYMGLALALKYVPDPYVQSLFAQVVDQLANYMLKTNFLGIHGSGGPTGVNQRNKFGGGGFWTSILLKMGAVYFPEKYEHIYYHYITNEMNYVAATEGGSQETISNYYAYNFGHDVVFGFLSLEEKDSAIWQQFYKGYLKSLWTYTKNHRNAYFNAIYLALSANPGDYLIIEQDIEDQLMRMRINHFPDRYYGVKPIPANYQKTDDVDKWAKYFETHRYGSLYKIAFPEVNWDGGYYTQPLTVEYRETDNFMWQRNPYEGPEYNTTILLYEETGMSFTVPYWIARAHGFIQPSGYR